MLIAIYFLVLYQAVTTCATLNAVDNRFLLKHKVHLLGCINFEWEISVFSSNFFEKVNCF